ncbi:MAG: hypothetical protein U0234_09980 [Sandaracinus sp.]
MPPEKPAIAPRGTFQDDRASEDEPATRRFVNGASAAGAPYRDSVAALRARRSALLDELEQIDRALAPTRQDESKPTPADRALSEPDWLGALAREPWGRPVIASLVALVLAVVALQQVVSYAANAPSFVREDASVVAVGDARFVVARTLLDRLATGRFERTALAPVVEDDVVVGLRIESSGRDEVSALGLEDGDVVLAVDDHALARPDGARRAFETIRLSPEFDVLVRRGDRMLHLHYLVVG